ncbi:MAG: hypothetical protein PVJ46_11520 [Methyloceanibacter sp.]|jgi:uncharacterized coiled-coil DUF342 family protein
MSERDLYVQEMKAKLDEWNAQVDRLLAKADAAQADAKHEYNEQVEALKKQREAAIQRLNELQSKSDDAWEDLKAGTDAAWDKMTSALKNAASRFQ